MPRMNFETTTYLYAVTMTALLGAAIMGSGGEIPDHPNTSYFMLKMQDESLKITAVRAMALIVYNNLLLLFAVFRVQPKEMDLISIALVCLACVLASMSLVPHMEPTSGFAYCGFVTVHILSAANIFTAYENFGTELLFFVPSLTMAVYAYSHSLMIHCLFATFISLWALYTMVGPFLVAVGFFLNTLIQVQTAHQLPQWLIALIQFFYGSED